MRVLVECGLVQARERVEWWVGVMGWLRGAGKWMGAVASARAVRRRKSGEEMWRGWAARAAEARAVRAAATRMPFCLKRFLDHSRTMWSTNDAC